MKMKDKELEAILEKISGIFDSAYEFAENHEEKIYICEVESDLHNYLKKKGMLE